MIGLEVHAQLLTASKAFCGCTAAFGNAPNTNVCPVCLGMPGTLPVLNRTLVDYIVRMGIATECRIAPRSILARKNYFYPDLPKGYQISQYEEPICTGGALTIDLDDGSRKRVGITRIHMEEDAGKSIHDQGPDTLVDLNRCGVPLIEIVTEPDLRSPREAYHALVRIRQLVTYLGICDGNMEEGSLRCDANVSLRKKGTQALGTKTEVKNMNSFRNVEKALEFEIGRQQGLLDDGARVVQETLLWDADAGVAIPMRSKEEAHDYRYFPDPDLVPVLVDEPWIASVRQAMPELPEHRRDRFQQELGLPRYDANVLTAEREVADFYEQSLRALEASSSASRENLAKVVSNWVMTDVLRVAGDRSVPVSALPVTPGRLAAMIGLILDGTISGKLAKDVFEEMLVSSEEPSAIVRRKGLVQVTDSGAIAACVDTVLAAHDEQVKKYLAGNEKIFGFFVGETMKLMQGKGNPKVVNELLRERLTSMKV
ncbi:MAG: glutamyl-tRNA(Gln) amidotransferase, subunit [Bacteroidetes bacterium]|nr:glutamyl-tRNA(Gln) amidotransferase, subunit [Bacteroidota bacterium]